LRLVGADGMIKKCAEKISVAARRRTLMPVTTGVQSQAILMCKGQKITRARY
jgi:hypothetical protein